MSDRFKLIDLTEHFNADGISYDSNRADGAFGVRISFPAEELPESDSIFLADGVSFLFPSKEDGRMNNIECASQVVTFEKDLYSKIHIVASCDNGYYLERVSLGDEEGLDILEIGVSNCISEKPQYNDIRIIQCTHGHSSEDDVSNFKVSLWKQTAILKNAKKVDRLILPNNPCFHIFAITLERGV